MRNLKLTNCTVILAIPFLLFLVFLTLYGFPLSALDIVRAKARVQGCADSIEGCTSPKYLGKKGTCACFSCQKSKPEVQLRVVCTFRPDQKLALFEAEQRDGSLFRVTQNALNKSNSFATFKENLQSLDLDPNMMTLDKEEQLSPSKTVNSNEFNPGRSRKP